MDSMIDTAGSWKEVRDIKDAQNLVDFGVLMSWKDIKHLRKVLPREDIESLARFFSVRLAERVETRLPEEILIESLLILLANCEEESVLAAFLDELMMQPNLAEACETLVELSLTAELTETENLDSMFSMAVALICELGSLLAKSNLEDLDLTQVEMDSLMDHISTYLLSVSNSSNTCIRLSLMHYFGVKEAGQSHKPGFNKIMGRFGHTALEHLFTLLFNKKTEAVALQFLLHSLPHVLEADNTSQKILHETWKFYMLKKPDRFALFIQTFSQHLVAEESNATEQARKMFMQHLGVLLKIVSEVNHKDLGREIMSALSSFHQDSYRNEMLIILARDEKVRDTFKAVIHKILDAPEGQDVVDEVDGFRSSRRGRKPSFAKAEDSKGISQAAYLGHQVVARAS